MTSKSSLAIFLISLFMLIGNNVFGQKEYDHGIRAGFITTDLSNQMGSVFDGNFKNFYLGIFRENNIGSGTLLSISTGLEYYQNGSRTDDDNKLTISNLAIPVGLKLHIVSFHGTAGISGIVRIGKKEIVNGMEQDSNTRDYKSFSGNYFFGVGASLGPIGVELRYHNTFSEIVDDYSADYWQLGASILF